MKFLLLLLGLSGCSAGTSIDKYNADMLLLNERIYRDEMLITDLKIWIQNDRDYKVIQFYRNNKTKVRCRQESKEDRASAPSPLDR